MTNYQLLVIDDELSIRGEGYKKLFCEQDNFGLTFADPIGNSISSIRNSGANAFLVDVNLGHPDLFRNVIAEIAVKRQPIVLVSSRWSEPDTLHALSSLTLEQRSCICHFLGWDVQWFDDKGTVNAKMVESTRLNIRFALDHHYGRCPMPILPDDPISFLHISDLHFGAPLTDPASFLGEAFIADEVRQHQIKFLIVSGDLTWTCQPHEYREAQVWLRKLAERLWPHMEMSDHIIIVPGNHDADLRGRAAGVHDFRFPDEKNPSWRLEKTPTSVSTYPLFAHFARMSETFAANASVISSAENPIVCCDRYLNSGIRFVLLNSSSSVDLSSLKTTRIATSDLNKLEEDLYQRNQQCSPEDLFTVAISHHGFSRTDETGFDNGAEIENAFVRAGVDMLLFGHGHAMVAEQRTHSPLCGLVEMMAPTPRIAGGGRSNDDLRGVNVVKLSRKSGLVTQVELFPYEIRGAKIRLRDLDGVRKWEPRKSYCKKLSNPSI
jgi:predicted phosphodiesterase